jgi:alpha-galactosidase
MEFGLWVEPEMVNPDSRLFREHPDWVLGAGERLPQLQRNQLVLDLTNEAVWHYLLHRLDEVLGSTPVDFVKWDHNRDLLEAGSSTRAGLPAVHRQTHAFYALLDALRDRYPRISWESCAAGGGRVDLGVIERVQRVWTSDTTDALSRQGIQRWTGQLVAPEYLGCHVSAPTSHQTGRRLPLGFRALTALFGAFGIEWDLTEASSEDLSELEGWVALHKRYRDLLHSGRMVRPETSDPAVIAHGVVSPDRRDALLAFVQLDESVHNRGARVHLPHLDPDRSYRLGWEGNPELRAVSGSPALPPDGPTEGRSVAGRLLMEVGLRLPRRRPQTVTLVRLSSP